jgi:DNA-directed RNA polymerase subunit beta'
LGKAITPIISLSFSNYDSMQACALADEIFRFKYASQAGISISIEDLKIPFVKNLMLEKLTKKL